MQLTDEQQKTVAGWVAQGDDLSTIQKRIADEWKVTMTYMEVRFLVDDMGAKLADKKGNAAVGDLKNEPDTGGLDEPGADGPKDVNDGAIGGVQVDVDRITRPGAVASGNVVFSDGVKGTWALDPQGRLGLGTDREQYSPSPEDLQSFQEELAKLLRNKGYA